MAIVGFNFTKINVERLSVLTGKIDIKNNVGIKDIKKKSISLGSAKQDGLGIIFHYTSVYEVNKKNVANVNLEGEIIVMEEAAKVKEALESWKKNKKVEEKLMLNILNTALTKCNIQALMLTRELNLPPPIPLPRVQSQAEASKYIG